MNDLMEMVPFDQLAALFFEYVSSDVQVNKILHYLTSENFKSNLVQFETSSSFHEVSASTCETNCIIRAHAHTIGINQTRIHSGFAREIQLRYIFYLESYKGPSVPLTSIKTFLSIQLLSYIIVLSIPTLIWVRLNFFHSIFLFEISNRYRYNAQGTLALNQILCEFHITEMLFFNELLTIITALQLQNFLLSN